MASIPFELGRNGARNLLVLSLKDFSAVGSEIISVRARSRTGAWKDSHIANLAGGAAWPTAFALHQERNNAGSVINEWIFAGLSAGRIHRGVYNDAVEGDLQWESQPELANTGPVRGLAEANGRLYAAYALRQDTPSDPITGGLYVRSDVLGRWVPVYQWPGPPELSAAHPEDLEMRGLTAVPDPHGDEHEVLIGARSWSGTIERIDPAADHAVTVELDVRDFLARRWSDDSIRDATTITAFTGFTPVTDPLTGETVHLAGLHIDGPGPSVPVYLIRHRDGTWEDASLPLADLATTSTQRAIRSVAPSPFPEENNAVLYFGGGNPGEPSADRAWIASGRWDIAFNVALNIESSDDGTIELTWPALGPDWILESSYDLTQPKWQLVSGLPKRTIFNRKQRLPIDVGAGVQQSYFRLRRN
ncbi:MAG: hypothetical protein KDN22_05565 [Verrucomicrobiae bacterium]|nr:hypothetical protein [Verrucomicrobiae bacterium]